jgi:DNA-binding LytR/AlgR family response regulator
VTYHIPSDEIEQVQAAGNYVEISWVKRTLLHRATLTAVEAELGKQFVRIHRGLLVRRDAIRKIETDKSGDFRLTLASGAEVRGSRRFRSGLRSS